jgi:hypothetical protein
MATTVNNAFAEFLADTVNLDPSVSKQARSSRDWLVEQITALPAKSRDFPQLYSEIDMYYGSFARRTKIRELDDVDMIVGLLALGTTYIDNGGVLTLTVPEGVALRALCFEGTNSLNSRKVINRFVAALADVPQYKKSELGRNGSAAVLNLTSYPWSFDIVPGFFTSPEWDNRSYYVIPDGNGYWMKTDPRVDQSRIAKINQSHSGNVLNTVRLIKFWNRRPTMPSMPSYLLECIVLNHYEPGFNQASQFVDLEVGPLLSHVANAVLRQVDDPKGIQGDINSLTWDARLQISSRASSDSSKAYAASRAETGGDHKESIRLWGEIFGPSFPSYG